VRAGERSEINSEIRTVRPGDKGARMASGISVWRGVIVAGMIFLFTSRKTETTKLGDHVFFDPAAKK